MTYQSARSYLGLPLISADSAHNGGAILGTVETITINPVTMLVDGFLIGRTGLAQNQVFLPREAVIEFRDNTLIVHNRTLRRPSDSRRVFGLQAWTTHPKFLVGFVYDFAFYLDTGEVESFTIHQILRTWRIPTSAVEKITPRALLIQNDTTVKLDLTPYPTN